MFQRIVLASCLAAASATPLQAAASKAEIDTYAGLLRRVIDREIAVVADSRMQDFKAMAGGDSVLAKILELHYSRVFSLSKAGDEGKRLADRAEALEKELKPLADSKDVPEEWRSLIIREPLDVILSLVNPIYRDLNPGMPVPATDLLPSGFVVRNEARVRQLMQAVDEALPVYDKQIKEWEPTLQKAYEAEDWGDKEWEAIFEGAIRRLKVINAFYISLKAFNEVLARGDEFGLSAELAKEIDTWLEEHMKARAEQFEDWDYNFSDYNIDFKHRLLVTRLEMSRNHGIDYANPKEMMPYIEDLLNMDEDQFSGAAQKRLARNLKVRFLDELMLWTMALAKSDAKADEVEQVEKTAARFWKQFYRDLRSDLRSRDRNTANDAANHFIMAARMFLAQKKDSEAMKLMSDIMAVKPPHPYAYNAKAWQDWLLTKGGGSGDVDWGAPIEPQDPETAISLAYSFRRAAGKKADPAEATSLRLKAAIALRNGIAGLSRPEYADKKLEFTPKIYQLYGYLFYEMGWLEHAVMAVQAGIQEIQPIWGNEKNGFKDNPYGDPRDRDKLDESGQLVQRLLDDFFRYSGMLRRQLDTPANDAIYKRANEWRREMNPNAEGGEKLEVITLMQDGKFEEAIAAAKKYGRNQTELKEQIWFQQAQVKACYDWLRQESAEKVKDEELIARITKIQAEETEKLRVMIKPELEKGDEGLEIAKTARALIIASEITELVRNEDWAGIIDMLDVDFWQRSIDRQTQAAMMNQLAVAAMKHGLAVYTEYVKTNSADPAELLAAWPKYEHAFTTLQLLEERFNQPLTSNRKRLANLMSYISKLSRRFVEGIEKGATEFAGIKPEDYARLTRISKASTTHYVDLYVPTLPEDTPITTFIALGDDLWSIGAKERALTFYERYLEEAKQRDDLKAYAENPGAVVDPVGRAILAARGSYKQQWDEIRDLLVDAPGLMKAYREANGVESKLNEKKVNFPKAYKLFREFREQMDKDKALLGDTSKLYPQVDGLLETVKYLAWNLSIRSRMVQGYMESGQTAKAVDLSASLIAYDPLYPPYMTVFVEGVLVKGTDATKTELKEAQTLAAKVRNMTKAQADMRMQYWTSACQVMELSLLLGEVDLVNRMVQRYAINQDDPTVDLLLKGTDPRQARDEGDVAVWKRFLRVYEAEGITTEKPFTIETDAEGNVVAIHQAAK